MATTIWKPDPALRALLAWTALTTLVFWLPLVRSLMDGDSYEWGFFGLHGKGLHGDLWFPVLGAALALATRWLGWRGARLPFHALLLLWVVPLGAGASFLSLTRPQDFRFQGDSLGIDISLVPAGLVLFGGFALLAIGWVIRDLRSGDRREPPPWTRTNTLLLACLAALLPVQFFLLRFGAPNSPRTRSVSSSPFSNGCCSAWRSGRGVSAGGCIGLHGRGRKGTERVSALRAWIQACAAGSRLAPAVSNLRRPVASLVRSRPSLSTLAQL